LIPLVEGGGTLFGNDTEGIVGVGPAPKLGSVGGGTTLVHCCTRSIGGAAGALGVGTRLGGCTLCATGGCGATTDKTGLVQEQQHLVCTGITGAGTETEPERT